MNGEKINVTDLGNGRYEVRFGFYMKNMDRAQLAELYAKIGAALGNDAQLCEVCEVAPVFTGGRLCIGCLVARARKTEIKSGPPQPWTEIKGE